MLLAVNRTVKYNNLWSTAAWTEIHSYKLAPLRIRFLSALDSLFFSFRRFCAITPSAFEIVGAFEALQQHKDESKGYSNRAEGLSRKTTGNGSETA